MAAGATCGRAAVVEWLEAIEEVQRGAQMENARSSAS